MIESRLLSRLASLVIVAAIIAVTTSGQAAVTAAQRQSLVQINKKITKGGNFFTQKKFKESGEAIKQAHAEVAKLAEGADDELRTAIQPVLRRLRQAHALLELEGIKLPSLKALEVKIAKAEAGKPMPATGGAVSFTKHVAPILIAKCGRCHVQRATGMFSMANFASLMKGSDAGVVLFAGDANDSRIVELIDNGDMPRGGLKITPDEFTTIKKWINEGAKYDSADPQASLLSLVPGARPANAPMLSVKQATGKETVSFAADIAPVLNKSCANCHGNGRRPQGRFNLTTFQGLLRGGESGAPIAPGKPADSLLVKMLKGTAGDQRMPARQPPLPDPVIAKIETWIKEGATFDGPNPGQHIAEVAALAKAKMLTHAQLSADRAVAAERNWALGMPGIDANRAETRNFLLLGNVGERTLADYGERAESLVPTLTDLFKVPADQPLIKGRMSLFFFQQRYDYSEFGKMVEKRQLPRSWRGHWTFSVVDAYGALIPPRSDEYTVEALLGQQIAGTYIASLGKVPRWFAEGSGRFAASTISPEDTRVRAWDDSLADVIRSMNRADDFLSGKLPPDQAATASYSFVKYLRKDAKRYNKLLAALRSGDDFTAVFSSIYGGSPAQLSERWVASAARQRSRR